MARNRVLPILCRNLVQEHLRAGFMKGTFGRKHFLHQRRLRSRENIPYLSLLLNLVSYGIFYRAPIELGNLLKFVKAYGHAKSCVFGQLSRQRKNIRCDRGGIKLRPFTEGQTDLASCHVDADVGLYLPPKSCNPIFDPLPRAGGAQHLLSKLFQELGVAGVAAHRQVDGMNMSLLQLEQGQSNERTLSEASRRQQEHLLTVC